MTGDLSAPYTLAPTLEGVNETVFYTYGDSNWKDKVTAIGGKAITYDAIGNPLTYDGWTFTWKAGRMLASMVKTGTNAQFTYDHNGMRIRKVVNGVTTNYTLNGKNVVHMTQGGYDLHFFYDAQGKPGMVTYNGVDYFYVYNLQGDVVALIDADGTQVVEYIYDAWGNPISKTGSLAATIGTLNPFRYRGYVYDEETGLYYLRSRYYNPSWKRFMNADALVSNGKGLLGKNVFTYCNNCPVAQSDPTGQSAMAVASVIALALFTLTGCTSNTKTPPWDYEQSNSKDQNCYGYAFGINSIDNPGDYYIRKNPQSRINNKVKTVFEVAELVKKDMQARNKTVRIIQSPDEVEKNEYVVALKTTTSPVFYDYHFARQLSDGTWADKQGVSNSRWNKIDGTAIVWDGPMFVKYNSETVYFAVKKEY